MSIPIKPEQPQNLVFSNAKILQLLHIAKYKTFFYSFFVIIMMRYVIVNINNVCVRVHI